MMTCDFGHVGRFDVPVVVEEGGRERRILILAMVKFSKSPKTSKSLLSLIGGGVGVLVLAMLKFT